VDGRKKQDFEVIKPSSKEGCELDTNANDMKKGLARTFT
jgi:hypothetical protein